MSLEAHPNINAAGLVSDVISALLVRARGTASGKAVLTSKVQELTQAYCIAVSEALDVEYGTVVHAKDR